MASKLNKAKFLRIFVSVAFLLITIFSVKLQIFEGKKYYRFSEENRIKKKYLTAPRGRILDRNNKEIANTRPGFYVSVIPAIVDTPSIEDLVSILNIKKENIIEKILQEKNPYASVKIAHDITFKQVSYIEEKMGETRGIELGVEPLRNYPYKDLFCHTIGYVDEVTKEEIKNSGGYRIGDYIGRAGLEKSYDSILKGKDGIEFIEVDVRGKNLGKVPEYHSIRIEPGNDIMTTLDLTLTESTAVYLKDFERGTVIALNPQNGEVYVLYSKPGFDPNLFVHGITDSLWQTLNNPSLAPLYNRATMSTYPIGSTIKPFIALAALDGGIIKKDKVFEPCRGGLYLGRKFFRCWKKHGTLNLIDAIVHSCNTYFYQLGRLMGIDIIAQYLSAVGFGKTTDIDLPQENKGLLPDRNYLSKTYGKKFTEGHIFNLSIGQGDILATPLQLATAYTVFTNRGTIVYPHLVKDGIIKSKKLVISENAVNSVIEGLYGVIKGGTGVLAQVSGLDICGKTGTAENPHGEDHAIFIGYAPKEEPRILVCVFIENAGKGGSAAAPIAGRIMKTFLRQTGYLKTDEKN